MIIILIIIAYVIPDVPKQVKLYLRRSEESIKATYNQELPDKVDDVRYLKEKIHQLEK